LAIYYSNWGKLISFTVTEGDINNKTDPTNSIIHTAWLQQHGPMDLAKEKEGEKREEWVRGLVKH